MSANIQLPYSAEEMASNARRNATSVISDTGEGITNYPPSMKIPFFRCLETGGGLIVNECYFRSADDLSLINVRRKHKHGAQTDEEGGLFSDILLHNLSVNKFGLDKPFDIVADFILETAGTSARSELTNSTTGRYRALNSTWNAGGNAGYPISEAIHGMPLSMSEKMGALCKLQMEFNTNLIARIGFGMEEPNTTTNTLNKVGIEGCNGTGINWQGVTANELNRTATPTSMGMKPAGEEYMRTYRFLYNPYTGEVKISNSDGGVKIITSTVPSTGLIGPQRLWRQGIVTTNSTQKKLWLAKTMFIGKNGDTAWFDDIGEDIQEEPEPEE